MRACIAATRAAAGHGREKGGQNVGDGNRLRISDFRFRTSDFAASSSFSFLAVSGAIGTGKGILGLAEKPRDVRMRHVCAGPLGGLGAGRVRLGRGRVRRVWRGCGLGQKSAPAHREP